MSDDFRRDQRSSRRFGGSGDPNDGGGRAGVGDDRQDDQDASRRVGGSGDPTDEPSGGGGSDPTPDPDPTRTVSERVTFDDFVDDQSASRRVGGSGDPADAVDQPDALDRAARTYSETVSEPVGDVVGDATPITAAEQATLGTNRSGRFFESAGETVAEFGNVPGIAAGARDTLQGRAATQNPVSAGPFVASAGVPDFEGREREARETTDAAARAAPLASVVPVT